MAWRIGRKRKRCQQDICELRGGEREHRILELRKHLLADQENWGLNPHLLHLLHCRQILLPLSHRVSPKGSWNSKGGLARGEGGGIPRHKQRPGKHEACFRNQANLEEKIHEHDVTQRTGVLALTQPPPSVWPLAGPLNQLCVC